MATSTSSGRASGPPDTERHARSRDRGPGNPTTTHERVNEIMIDRTKTRVALTVGALFLATAAGLGAQDFEWSGAIDRGDAVTIRGVNGEIRARRASGDQVRVTASKRARRDDPSSVDIQVVEDDRGVLICAVYPSRDDDRPNRCARGDRYHMNNRRNDVQVDFVVEVPDGVELDAVTVNGDVDIRGLASRVDATTVNGSIEIETRGSARATTVNGGITARMGRIDSSVEFTTVNGSVDLTLPGSTHADVEMSTVNGSIETDFPITVRGRWGPRSARGEIGDGGPMLEVTTVNGSIRLHRAG